MKRFILLSIALAFFSVAVMAIDPSFNKTMTVVREGSVFRVFYKSGEHNDVKINIYDEAGYMIFTEVIRKSNGFIRPYNFNRLTPGEYQIEIVDLKGRQIERVSFVNETKEEEVAAALVKLEGNGRYMLVVPNKTGEALTMAIYDETGRQVYAEAEKITRDFSRLYNLSDMAGEFTFRVTNEKGISHDMRAY